MINVVTYRLFLRSDHIVIAASNKFIGNKKDQPYYVSIAITISQTVLKITVLLCDNDAFLLKLNRNASLSLPIY